MKLPIQRQSLRSLSRRIAMGLLCAGLFISAAIIVNVIGIQCIGDVKNWHAWQKAHALYFLVWRLFLYGAITAGWLLLRQRLRQHQTSVEIQRRLLRIEIAAIAAMVLLEISTLLQRG